MARSDGRTRGVLPSVIVATLALSGCADSGTLPTRPDDSEVGSLTCSIPASQIFNGGPGKDGIPALTDPEMVAAESGGLEYLREDDRVIGIFLDGEVLAIPLNILWWHEIVNLQIGGRDLAVTHCPLTGSSLAFDRAAIGGAELGVSGLLYMNNLLMYDRTSKESLWPQMLRAARCGPRDGTTLAMVAVMEVTWEGWRELHPGTRVVSGNTGFDRPYSRYPYGTYDQPNDRQLLFPIPEFDTSRPPKERVLVVPAESLLGAGGIGFPYGLLDDRGSVAAVHAETGGTEFVVFWDAAKQAAMAYEPMLDGEGLRFSVDERGIVDVETGTLWRVDGVAVEGELRGRRLHPVAEAFVAFWFAWRAFYPEAEVWSAS